MDNRKSIGGIFCISLDFEKYWGLHDVCSWQQKLEELRSVSELVPRLLNTFSDHDTHVSWAMVGLLAEKNPLELLYNQIPYTNEAYSPFPTNKERYVGIPANIITAEEEINLILSTKGQELCSHTYSHYYTLEEGQSDKEYSEDILRMAAIGAKLSNHFSSIVFPRNQINQDYLKLSADNGYNVFRGNQKNNLWANSPYAKESLSKKGKRFLDAYYNISNTQASKLQELETVEGLINVPASRFLRPSTGKTLLEKRKLKRIKEEMTRAAEHDEIYHLWWHPHNFSKRTDEHFDQLQQILQHFNSLNKAHGMQSLNMKEIGAAAKK